MQTLAKLDVSSPKLQRAILATVEERLRARRLAGPDEKNIGLSIAQLYQTFEFHPELVPQSIFSITEEIINSNILEDLQLNTTLYLLTSILKIGHVSDKTVTHLLDKLSSVEVETASVETLSGMLCIYVLAHF